MEMNKAHCRKLIRLLKTEGTRFPVDCAFLVAVPFAYGSVMPECVEQLSRWRIENPSLSPARFPISNSRTERWLRNSILNNEDRVLFMIQNRDQRSIGHIGLSDLDYSSSTVKIDSVLKGIKTECPGIMSKVIEFLKQWCRENLGAKRVELVVLDDNERAIQLYHRCNFKADEVIPLQKVEDNGEISWVRNDNLEHPEKRFIHMVCDL